MNTNTYAVFRGLLAAALVASLVFALPWGGTALARDKGGQGGGPQWQRGASRSGRAGQTDPATTAEAPRAMPGPTHRC